MSPGRSKDLVAAGALLAALLFGTWLTARSSQVFGARWTDGERRFDAETGAGIRHAVFDPPRAVPGLEGDARDPALSPDGRFLVFAAGERGLNAELYAAELVDGAARAPEPIARLNSSADELAPAFGHGALYFASDRPGGLGGLDLWRAPYGDGVFGAPELLAPGVNSPAEETDPAPLDGTTLLLASDRARGARVDFDLYRAELAAGRYALEPVEALNTTRDERDPAATADRRCLYFAAQTEPGTFELRRSLRTGVDWGTPAPVPGLDGARAQRGPCATADGFELWFSAPGEGAEHELLRARSRELFPLPRPLVSLAEWLFLAGLLLLAVLALLAKRWHALDVIYKAVLVSLLLHLLLLYYLRSVYPRSEALDLGAGRDAAFRVRLAPSDDGARAGGPQASLGREGLAPERERFAAELVAIPALAALSLPERGPEEAPERERLSEPAAAPAPSPSLADREARPERRGGAAPALVFAPRAAAGPAPSAEAPPARRSADASTDLGPAAPAAAGFAVSEAAAADRASGIPAQDMVRTAASGPPIAVSAPVESFERARGAANAFELPAAALTPIPSGQGAPGRQPLEVAAASEPALPSGDVGTLLPAARGVEEEPAPAPERLALGAAGPTSEMATALRAPREARVAPGPGSGSGSAGTFDPIRGLGRSSTERSPLASAGNAPERARLSAALPAPPAQPAPPALAPAAEAEALPAPDRGAGRDTPPRLAETPYQNRFGEQKLRALEEFGGGAETEHAVAAGLAYLAGIQEAGGAWGQRGDAHAKYLDVRIGKTGLALLAFLGAGHLPGGGTEYAGTVERALEFLLASQDEATGHYGRSCSYGHGIATYALAECLALTREERLRGSLERAVAEILRHQSAEPDPRFLGGWGYYFADGHVWNGDAWPRTSVTAWQVMALESARLSGLGVPALAFERAREFLLNTWDARARAFRYDHDPARLSSGYPILPASTPAALFGLSLLGVDAAAPELAQARRFVLARLPDGYRYTGDDDFVAHARGNLYFWYYASLAMFRAGGSSWESWNGAMKDTLLTAQEQDGSWRPLDAYSEYAGDEDDERAYTTAMCVLSLEVYYRYFTPLLTVK